ATARKELNERETGLSTTKAVEEKMTAALVEAKRLDSRTPSATRARGPRSSGIVVYGTSWCGYCRKARQWFKSRGIAFEDKDVERDPGAAQELAQKAAAAGVQPRGVPVIDVRGTLVLGYDVRALDRLLK
ncbi:MAG TPA: glutaredoxin domain-containing protein, partial [Myxococcaceae bacterium]|nr:glutaredoxin domain-containing protein [Myxococcaceae bacterium]